MNPALPGEFRGIYSLSLVKPLLMFTVLKADSISEVRESCDNLKK